MASGAILEECRQHPAPTIDSLKNFLKSLNSDIKTWSCDKTLLLVSILHTMVKEGTMGKGEKDIDWNAASLKLGSATRSRDQNEVAFTAKECENRYQELMQRVEVDFTVSDKFRIPITLAKRQFIIRAIAAARVAASEVREQELKRQIKDMARRIRSIETMDLDSYSDISDAEGTDSEDEDSKELRDFPDAGFSDEFMRMFNVDDRIFRSLPIDATIDAIINAGLTEETINLLQGAPGSPPNFSVDFQPGNTPVQNVSSQLKNLVHSAIAGTTEDDSSKTVSPTNAPTLSRLLEMPPRDRGQPLPAIQSLMTPTSEAIESPITPLQTPLSMSPLTNESPTKLLASLGTTSTPVKIVKPYGTGRANLPGLILQMPLTPLKPMEDIEIAHDYVMASGLVKDSSEQFETSGTVVSEPTNSQSADLVPSTSVAEDKDVEMPDVAVESSSVSSSTVQGDQPVVVDANQTCILEKSVVPIQQVPPVVGNLQETEKMEVRETVTEPLNASQPEIPKPVESVLESNAEDGTRLKSVSEDANVSGVVDSKEENANEKRVTRARAKTSNSPVRTRTKSSGSSKGSGNTGEADTTNEADPGPSRATRSRAAAASSTSSSSHPVTESLPLPPSSTSVEEPIEVETREVAVELSSSAVQDDQSVVVDSGKPAGPEQSVAPNQPSLSAADIVKPDKTEEVKEPLGEPKIAQPDVVISVEPGSDLNVESVTKPKSASDDANLSGAGDTKDEHEKRVTRARAKTSTSPVRNRTKSTGSSKGSGNTAEADTTNEADPGPPRATRSRAAAAASSTTPGSSSHPVIESLPPLPLESNPSSPASSTTNSTILEEDKDQRAFRKSMMLIWNRIATHKFASIFLKPITDDNVPGYSKKVKRPMDLSTIKRNIETGVIKTLVAMERDLYLMYFNALMFNPTSSSSSQLSIYQMNTEMANDTYQILEEFKATQSQSPIKPTPEVTDMPKKETTIADSEREGDQADDGEPKVVAVVKTGGPGRKRGSRASSIGNNATEESTETKRRILRTSTAAATTATTSWQSTSSGMKKKFSPDITVAHRVHRDRHRVLVPKKKELPSKFRLKLTRNNEAMKH